MSVESSCTANNLPAVTSVDAVSSIASKPTKGRKRKHNEKTWKSEVRKKSRNC